MLSTPWGQWLYSSWWPSVCWDIYFNQVSILERIRDLLKFHQEKEPVLGRTYVDRSRSKNDRGNSGSPPIPLSGHDSMKFSISPWYSLSSNWLPFWLRICFLIILALQSLSGLTAPILWSSATPSLSPASSCKFSKQGVWLVYHWSWQQSFSHLFKNKQIIIASSRCLSFTCPI